jgi:lipopolysaccharide/colanic/teichoic acid biosynthesis glycosyltransferase
MRLVGPRPEVRQYVEMFRQEVGGTLHVLPGVTELVSLRYCDGAELLGFAENPEGEYGLHVLPQKIRSAREYLQRFSVSFDILVILDEPNILPETTL